MASLLTLPDDDLIDAIAAAQWDAIVDGANGCYARPEKDRTAEIRRLAASARDDDRYVAYLVRQWLRPSPN